MKLLSATVHKTLTTRTIARCWEPVVDRDRSRIEATHLVADGLLHIGVIRGAQERRGGDRG